MKTIIINPASDLVFDTKAREMCKSCKRYGQKATCPPNIESVDYYRGLLPRYEYGTIYYEKFYITEGRLLATRSKSSRIIQNVILSEIDRLFNQGHYFVIGFGGGSCKRCKKCVTPCPMPSKSLIPLEATGIHVVALMKSHGVEVRFPARDYFYRIGAVFYD